MHSKSGRDEDVPVQRNIVEYPTEVSFKQPKYCDGLRRYFCQFNGENLFNTIL
jgi:hypothetical protein